MAARAFSYALHPPHSAGRARNMTLARRSPGVDKPVRAPELRSGGGLVSDKILPFVTAALLFWVLSVLEWLRLVQPSPPNPLVITALAALFSVFAAWRICAGMREHGRLRRAQQGDCAIANLLMELSAKGFRVFHDVPAEQGRIDHVIVCAQGLYTLAIQRPGKPAAGPASLTYDGETIRINGSTPCGKTVAKSRAQAMHLRRYLKERTGRAYTVRPVIVFPGWQVKRARRNADVWVTAPRTLHQWIDRDPAVLDLADIKMAANTLTRYIRASGQARAAKPLPQPC
jgi:hypothetical protein